MLGIAGIGALIAVTGGIMFMTVVLTSVFTGKQEDANRLTLVASEENPLVTAALPNTGKEISGNILPRGTVAITFAFLMFFILYYFSNWWLLGRAWFIH